MERPAIAYSGGSLASEKVRDKARRRQRKSAIWLKRDTPAVISMRA